MSDNKPKQTKANSQDRSAANSRRTAEAGRKSQDGRQPAAKGSSSGNKRRRPDNRSKANRPPGQQEQQRAQRPKEGQAARASNAQTSSKKDLPASAQNKAMKARKDNLTVRKDGQEAAAVPPADKRDRAGKAQRGDRNVKKTRQRVRISPRAEIEKAPETVADVEKEIRALKKELSLEIRSISNINLDF